MQETEFRQWLQANGANSENGRNTRVFAVKKIESYLAALGSPHSDLDAAWDGDRFGQLRSRLKDILTDAKNGGGQYRLLMPQSEEPLNRLVSWSNWLMQYGKFLDFKSVGDKVDTMTHADRIRQYALEHYIVPARTRGDVEVTIIAGVIHKEMGLKNLVRDVCVSLAGKKFQDLTNVSKPVPSGPKDSTTTSFRFRLRQAETKVPNTTYPAPTNLILYGPPGTGKTYRTAAEAVRLCDGLGKDNPLLSLSQRDALRQRYHDLVEQKRIRFVTFHQSYSYEDFVEGLRPDLGNDAEGDTDIEGGKAQAGFQLKPVPGIFRNICELADDARTRGTRSTTAKDGFDLTGRKVWKMSLGSTSTEGIVFDRAVEESYIVLGWGGDVNWSDKRFDDSAEIKAEWLSVPREDTRQSNYSQLSEFRNSLQVGDVVIVPYGNSQFRALGIVTGDYVFNPTGEGTYNHRRQVRWVRVLDKPLALDTIVEGNFTMRSFYEIGERRLNKPALLRLLEDDTSDGDANATSTPEQFVLVIDEINRANISKVFGELITLLEPDKRLGMPETLRVVLPYSKTQFGVPSNLHVIGTMNTADRSIALLDTALRRRFQFEEIEPHPDLLDEAERQTGVPLVEVLKVINRRIEYLLDRDHRIGHAYFLECKTLSDVNMAMRHKIVPLLQEYFFEDWGKVYAVLGSGFISCSKLKPPPGFDGEDRESWAVFDKFSDDAYRTLISGGGGTPEIEQPSA